MRSEKVEINVLPVEPAVPTLIPFDCPAPAAPPATESLPPLTIVPL